MGSSGDFVELLGKDMSMKILMCLDDPSDLVRATAVSSSWCQFVIENGLCKQHCLRMCPELSNVVGVIDLSDKPEMVESRLHDLGISEKNYRDHNAYSLLARDLTLFAKEVCIADLISAPRPGWKRRESIADTMEANDINKERKTYWFSRGKSDPAVPENLVFELVVDLCLISEIHIQPFQAYFDLGSPIFSAKAVRFRMGHMKSFVEMLRDAEAAIRSGSKNDNDVFIWTYTSPDFPIDQAANSQKFQLPKPVLCTKGYLKVELLGRVQKNYVDDLYCMWLISQDFQIVSWLSHML